MPALKRLITSFVAPVLTAGALVVAAPTAPAATSSLAWGGYSNGKIPATALCAISWQKDERLRCDATRKLTALNQVYKARWGANICVNDAYRSYASQVAVFEKYGSPRAAKPGTSTHGWGLAIDLGCGLGSYTDARHRWFTAVAPRYGIAQPLWARAKGSNPEPWHWQYFGSNVPAASTQVPVPPKPVPAPPSSKAATSATVTVTGTWPRTATLTLRAKATGTVIAGAPVTVMKREGDATEFTTVGTFRTDEDGRVAYRTRPEAPTVVTFSYAGSATRLPVSVTTRLTTVTRMDGQFVRDRRGSFMVGRLTTPRDDAIAGQTVHLQRRSADSTTWTTVLTLTTNERGYVWSEVDREQDTFYRFSYPGKAGQYVGDVSRDAYVGFRDGSGYRG